MCWESGKTRRNIKKKALEEKNYELLEEFKIKDKVVKIVTDNEAKRHSAYKDNERVCCIAVIFHSSMVLMRCKLLRTLY